MSIRKIAALLHGNAHDRLVLDAALQIARPRQARIEAIHLASGPADIRSLRDQYFPDFAHDLDSEYRKVAKQMAETSWQTFRSWANDNKVADPSWREESLSAEDAVRRIGQFSDLMVIERPGGRLSALDRYIVQTALFATGHPVLLVPPEADVNRIWSAAAIAWNGSVEAMHAIGMALPILRDITRAYVLTVGDPVSPDDLLAFLARHQISSELLLVPHSGPIGAVLLAEAAKRGAEFLVMGAYTHSPTREQFFGGATAHILAHADLPVLMAH